jgi:hypothetical protein
MGSRCDGARNRPLTGEASKLSRISRKIQRMETVGIRLAVTMVRSAGTGDLMIRCAPVPSPTLSHSRTTLPPGTDDKFTALVD